MQPFASYGTVSYDFNWCNYEVAYIPELNAILMSGGQMCSSLNPYAANIVVKTTRTVYLWENQTEPVPGDYNMYVSPDMSVARWSHALVRYGRKVYAVGGAIADNVMTASVEIFDFDANSWSNGPSLPDPRATAGCAVSENTLVCAGGVRSGGQYFRAEAWKLNLSDPSASWVSLPNLLDTAQDPLLLASNNFVYAFGGYRNHGSWLKSSQVIDLSSSSPSWTQTLEMPQFRKAPRGVVSDGENPNLYIYAGSDKTNNMVNKLLRTSIEEPGGTGAISSWVVEDFDSSINLVLAGTVSAVYPQLIYSDQMGVVFINVKTTRSVEMVSIWQATCSANQFRVGDYCKECPAGASSPGGNTTRCNSAPTPSNSTTPPPNFNHSAPATSNSTTPPPNFNNSAPATSSSTNPPPLSTTLPPPPPKPSLVFDDDESFSTRLSVLVISSIIFNIAIGVY